jgi:hypothetical protein
MPATLQAEGQVLLHRHLRIERIGLEHHADAAVLGLFPGDVLALDEDLAFGDVEQAGNAVEQGRLAAAGRPEQHDELAIGDIEIERLQHGHRAEIQRQVLDRNAGAVGCRHRHTLSPRRRRCRARKACRK